jgi:hypothetical protein
MSQPKSTLGLFNDKLIGFFEDLAASYPEERDIAMALEGIRFAKKSNPKLILDLFMEYISKPLRDPILAEDEETVIAFAHKQIQTQFNEMSPALTIFNKHWPTMTEANQKAIWNHLKVLVLLSEKARGT